MENDVSLVYYIGAGASAKSLPLVSNTPERMRALADELARGGYSEDISINEDLLCKLTDTIKLLADDADRSASIDVLARQCYLREDRQQLRDLKAALSTFFLLEQSRLPADPRYADFFAYMADRDTHGSLAMPTNLRVISWNYDMQFEKSFAEFIDDPGFQKKRSSGEMLQVIPTGVESGVHSDGLFAIYKLNGTAGARDNNGTLIKSYDPVVYSSPGRLAADNLRLSLHFFDQVSRGADEPYLQFAWEDDNRRVDMLTLISRFTPVETIVVIGYSFPVFNRNLDREVFKMLRPNTVYVQVAGDDAVTDRLSSMGVDPDKIKVVRDQDQFHIPYSYSPSTRRSGSSDAT